MRTLALERKDYGTLAISRDKTASFLDCMTKSLARRQKLRTGDEDMQAENWGFLAWRTSSRPGSEADYFRPTGLRLCSILVRIDGLWC